MHGAFTQEPVVYIAGKQVPRRRNRTGIRALFITDDWVVKVDVAGFMGKQSANESTAMEDLQP